MILNEWDGFYVGVKRNQEAEVLLVSTDDAGLCCCDNAALF